MHQALIGDDADFAVLKCDGIARIGLGANPVETQQLAIHAKTSDMIATIF